MSWLSSYKNNLVLFGHVEWFPVEGDGVVGPVTLFEVLDGEPSGRQSGVCSPGTVVVVLGLEGDVVDGGRVESPDGVLGLGGLHVECLPLPDPDVRVDGVESGGREDVSGVALAPVGLPGDGEGRGCSVQETEDMGLSGGEGTVRSPEDVSVAGARAGLYRNIVHGFRGEPFEFDGIARHHDRVILGCSGDSGVLVEGSNGYSKNACFLSLSLLPVVGDQFLEFLVEYLRRHPVHVEHGVALLDQMEISGSRQPREKSLS